MSGLQISQMPVATTPLSPTDIFPLVQVSNRQATVADVAAASMLAPTAFKPIGTGSVARSVAGKLAETISLADFGAVGDGVTDNRAVIQAALNAAAAAGVRFVTGVAAVNFLISGSITVPAGVELVGVKIKQAAGGNASELIVLGSGSGLRRCVVDGNGDLQTHASGDVAVRIGAANNCYVRECEIFNCSSYGIVTNGGLNATVTGNTIHSFRTTGVSCFDLNATHGHKISDNYFYNIGWSAVLLQQSDGSEITGNKIIGSIVGGRGARMRVNTTVGGVVTWVSGPNFTGLRKGNFFVVDNGKEYRITDIASVTSMTVAVGAGLAAFANVEASAGAGDLIGVIASNHFKVDDNFVSTTATFGVGSSLLLTGTPMQCSNGSFSRNRILYAGKNAINLNSAGAGTIENILVADNQIFNAGWSGGITTADRIAIILNGDAASTINISIRDNVAVSYVDGANPGQTSYMLGTDSLLSAGTAFASGNTSIAMANQGILGDVLSVVLTSDWGATTTVTNTVSVGNSVRFQIDTSGAIVASGLGVGITVSKIFSTGDDPVMLDAKIISTNFAAGANLWTLWAENLSTRGVWTAYSATAVAAGQRYVVQMKAA